MRRLPGFLRWLVLGLATGVLYWYLLERVGATWGIWAGAFALCAIALKLISYADDLLKAIAAMWRPLILIVAAAYLLFSNDQGRELGVSLMAEKSWWRISLLFLVLIYWAANNWHTARLGLDVAEDHPKGNEKWLFWPPRLLGVCAHLFAAINLSLAAANQPEFAASGLLVPWSATFAIVLAAALIWILDHFWWSAERMGHEPFKSGVLAVVIVLLCGIAYVAVVVALDPGASFGFSLGTISISASAIVFLTYISWRHHKKPRGHDPADDPRYTHRFLTAGLFFVALAGAYATWSLSPVVVGRFCGSMVVAYFAFGAILALVNAFELVVFLATKTWFADTGTGVVGAYAVAFLIGLAVLNTWPQPFHRVRLCDGGDCVDPTSPDGRPTVAAAARAWYKQAKAVRDNAGRTGPVPMLIVATAGGGIRAAYWTATVLEQLRDDFEKDSSFERGVRPYLFAISGVSGGSIGAAAFDAALAQRDEKAEQEKKCQAGTDECPLATTFLNADFLAPALASLVFVDVPTSFLPDFGQPDRGTALERSFETESKGLLTRPFLSLFNYDEKDPTAPWRPILLLNATHEETGKRIITGHVLIERNVFIDSLDALHVLGKDVRASTAAHNSARFTYISPAGALGNNHGWVIDGGYFENYGALSALELARAARLELENEDPGVKLVILMISSDPNLERAHELVRIREAKKSGRCRVSVTEREGTSSVDASGSQKSEELPNYLSIDKEQVGNAWINEFVAPVQGITKVREAHGNRAAAELAVEICSEFSKPPKTTSGVPSALQSQSLTSSSPQTQIAAALDKAKDENVDDSPPVKASHQKPYFAHLAMCEEGKEGQPAPVQAPLGWVLSNATQQAFGKLLQQCGNDHELSQLEIALGRQAKQRVAGPSAE